MEKGFSELEERKIFAALQSQISVFTSQQSKNFDSLKILIEQLRVKQISKPHFDAHSFSLNIYRHHQTIQQLLEKIATKMKTISPIEKLSILLLEINKLFDSLLTISNNKWCEKLKILEEKVGSRIKKRSFDSQLCSGCKQNRWHQLIKWQKHQINHIHIEDPYNYYQQGPVAKEYFGEEINQKVIQQKLAQLASGVEMEQECLRKLIQEMDLQQKSSQKSFGTLPAQGLNITFPIVPILRSVFHKIRVKKETFDTGIQVESQPLSKPGQNHKSSEGILNKQEDQEDEKDKALLKLQAQLSQKLLQIKILQEKIEFIQKNENHLKISNEILMEQNIQLHKRNSSLEVEINLAKVKPIVNRLKMNHKTAIIKNDTEINKEQKFQQLSTTYNPNAQLQSTNYHDRTSDLLKTINKVKASGMFDSKFKPTAATLNKPLLSPNYEEKSSTKSINSSNFPTSKIIHRESGKSIESSSGMIKDNQMKRPSIHKNDFIKNNKGKIIDQNGVPVEISKTSKSQRKLKQNGIHKSIGFTENPRQLVRSENVSPQNDNRSRRLGKFQDRQSLLKILFNYQMKDKEKLVDFDFFKKSYERFLLKMVSFEEEDAFSNITSKPKHLHKKSTLSIKQYLRHDMSNSNEGLPTVNSTADHSILNSDQRQQSSLEKIRQMQKYLLYQSKDKDMIGDFFRKGKVLNKQQLALIIQIFAYLIQMKVTKKQSYKHMRQMILGMKEPVKGKDQENQIKEKISNILRFHRGCSRDQNKGVCEHIKNFISDIVGLISL